MSVTAGRRTRGIDDWPGTRRMRVLVRTILSSAGWTAQPPTDTGAVRESCESRYIGAFRELCDEVIGANPQAGFARDHRGCPS